MRFASKYGRMLVQIRPQIVEHYAAGTSKVLQESVFAEFRPGGLEPFERELVLSHWHFNGAYQELDEATIVPPDYRIGVFDSVEQQRQHAWSDQTRNEIEDALTSIASLYEHIFALPATTVAPPWPNYDEFKGTVGALLKKLEDDGHDLRRVLIYERAMQNREALIDALTAKLDGFELEPQPEEEEIVA